MSTRDWASGGGAKIERAKEHVGEFERASRAFLEAHRYTAVSKFNPQRREVSFYVNSSHAIPPRLAMIAANAIQDLRAALDILWHQVWSGGKPAYRNLYWPFVEDADELKARYRTVKKPAQKAAVDIVRTAQFYKSRHKLIRVFEDLANRDKHEIPILAAASYKRVIVYLPPGMVAPAGMPINLPAGPLLSAPPVHVPRTSNRLWLAAEIEKGFVFLEHGTKLPFNVNVETNVGAIMHMDCDLTPDIAFGEGEILEGEPVLKTLHELTELVEGVTNAFLTAGLIR